MEDSCGLGLIGKTGRGTCEYYGVDPNSIDLITGNLEPITSSVGGFCAASKKIVYHLRLNATGYVYSASLPPLLAAASISAFDLIDEQPQLLSILARNSQFLFKGLSTIPGLVVGSQFECPIIHVGLAHSTGDRYLDEKALQRVVDEALIHGVFLTRAKYVHSDEKFLPPATIRVTVSAAHTIEQLSRALETIRSAAKTLGNSRTFDSPQSLTKRTSTGTF